MWGVNRSSRLAQRGFTLVEVIVATSVIVVGVLATVTVANVSVGASGDNERKVVATNLAREGLELVRNIRDTNWQTYVTQQKAESARTLSVPERSLAEWDCFPATADQADDYAATCSGRMSAQFKNPAPAMQATVGVLANNRDSSPYLQPVTAFAGFSADNTQNPGYLICRQANPVSGVANIYIPTTNSVNCATDSKAYKRRITIESRRGDSCSDSIYVKSSVSWEGLPAEREIVIEEYLTDWRKFSDGPPCGGTP